MRGTYHRVLNGTKRDLFQRLMIRRVLGSSAQSRLVVSLCVSAIKSLLNGVHPLFQLHSAQHEFQKGDECSENVTLLDAILRDATQNLQARCSKSYHRDNGLVVAKRPERRRFLIGWLGWLFLSLRSRIRQALDCSRTNRECELGFDRREAG